MTEDFQDWKRHPITQVVLAEFSARIKQLTEELVFSAGVDAYEDAVRSAAIKAYRDIVNVSFSDIEEAQHAN